MTSPWSVPVFDNLTIPTSAGPGEARIVIASKLPPPLDTYLLAAGFGYKSGIIFYSNGDDTTYNFLVVGEDNQPNTALTHYGSVVGGAVVESAPGVPDVYALVSDFIAGAVANHSIAATLEAVLRTTGDGGVGGTTLVEALGTGGIVAVTADGPVNVSAGGNHALQVGGVTQLNGNDAYYVTHDEVVTAAAGITLNLVATLIPGCSIQVLPATPNSKWSANIACYFEETVAGVVKAFGELYVDGVAQTAIAVLNLNAVADGATVSQNYGGVFATAGLHTFELRARKNAALGTVLAQSPHCTLAVKVMETGG